MSRETKNLFPVIQTSPVLQGERGTIVYVLMGALAVSGGLAVVADRNLRSVNEQAFEGASALARETNVSALNMLKTLMAMPVGNPSARNPQHVPAVFPDKYVNSTSPYSSKIDLIADNLPATAQAIWRVNRASAVPEIQISSPDLRFISATAREANIFSAAHYSAAPSGPASVQTRITSVMPVYSGALITAYDVAVDSRVAISARDASKGSRTVTTKARIAVDPPPVPECDMTVSTSGPVIPNTPIVANFRSYGVVLSARTMQPLNSGVTQWSSVTPLSEAAKSIRSTLQGGTLLRTWTVNARSTKPFDSRQGIMAIEGDVTGPALS
ncbi:MAG: hypothetical protein EBU49_07535, partial [Proteobacteria bacterium]|nr:hypothetical protein [Pseudomonadota bacterium]